MSAIIWLSADTLTWSQGGGHLWPYLNWALGLRALGCEVIWLESVDPGTDLSEVQPLVLALKSSLERYGLADSVALCSRTGDPLPGGEEAGCVDIESAADADLLLNVISYVSQGVLDRFRRTALLDIDPGLTQIWMSEGVSTLPSHDVYFTIGETVGRAGTKVPDGGLTWEYTPPCVALDWWPRCPARDGAPFTTVSTWESSDYWVTYRDESYPNSKRDGFLPFLDLPKQTTQSLELALCLAADQQLHLTSHEHEERVALEERGWRVVHSYAVASTPWDYQSYIQGSRGEFSCAKPSYVRFQDAWISDRTLCYLASGKPAVVQHTGPSRSLPDAAGLFRFRDVPEAVKYLEAVAADYERQCRLARALAEEFFDAETVVRRVLERALS